MTKALLCFAFLSTGLSGEPETWTDALGQANSAHRENRNEAAEKLYRSALQLYRKSGGADANLAVLLNNIASECQILSKYDQAESLYKESIVEWRRVAGTPNGLVRTLTNLAGLYRVTTRYALAEETYLEALNEFECNNAEESVEYASALSKTADLYRTLGKWQQALPIAEHAVRIGTAHLKAGDVAFVNMLQVLACVYLDAGRWDDAVETYDRTRILLVKSGRAGTIEAAAAYTGLGRVAALRGQFARAESDYRHAAEIYLGTLGPDASLYAVALNNIAQSIRHQQQNGDAEQLFDRALGILDRGTPSAELASCLANFADFQHSMGREGQAAAHLARAVSILQAKLGNDHHEVALLRVRLAEVRRAQRNYVEAVRLYRATLPTLAETLGATHPQVQATTSAYSSLLKEADSFIVMVR